jgi:hypothetical protein
MKGIVFSCLVAVSLGFAGCATDDAGARRRDLSSGAPAVPAKDKVLWNYKNSLVALRQGNFQEAKRLLDDALLSIGGTLGPDRNAKLARSYFHGEGKKTFIGEPYERVMAYYYRGILYWMDGEPDNARACFRSAQIQDSDTENKEYASDYVLLDYLDALATMKLEGDGTDALKRSQKTAKLTPPPAPDPKANVLFFVDFGSGPQKYAGGQYSEQLRFRKDPSPVHGAILKVNNQQWPLKAYDDLYFQATSRGGRVMDHILANKAVFKSATDTAGNVALVSGLVLSQNRNTQEAALGLAAFGVLSKIVSATTTPSADTRAWDNLPGYLSFAAVSLPPGQHMATIEFQDSAGRPLPSMTKTVVLKIDSAGVDKVVYVSDRSTSPLVL